MKVEIQGNYVRVNGGKFHQFTAGEVTLSVAATDADNNRFVICWAGKNKKKCKALVGVVDVDSKDIIFGNDAKFKYEPKRLQDD